MDWSKGYSASYYMTMVDPVTWRDAERIELVSGSIKRQADGLMQSADVTCVNYPTGVERWVRIYLDTDQEDGNAHVPLFTGLATSPGENIDGVLRSASVQCYSVLKPAADMYLLRGWYAPAGVSGGTIIRQLLGVTNAPVVVEDNAPALQSYIIAENNETYLTMIQRILTAINWRIRIAGDGTISVEPISDEPVATFDPFAMDVLETKIKVKADWFSCPNVFMAIDDDLTAIARDDSEASPLSTVNRGREVWAVDTSCALADNETIEEYSNRRLKEKQRIKKTAEYDRRFFPDVMPGDMIRLHYPEQNIDGAFRVASQSIALAYAATTSEVVTEE